MWALVIEQVVAETTDIDPAGRFHPTLEWVKCPTEVRIGWHFDGDAFTPPQPQLLEKLKQALKASIDADAEAERLKYITAGTGQAMTYQRKVEEARRLLADQDVDPVNYPMLSATVGIDGDTLADVAQLVLNMDAAWAVVGAAIEHARMSAKAAIDSAADESAAKAVEAVWPELAG